jgi:RNA polymerase sigma-70 factor (sigma-E family)
VAEAVTAEEPELIGRLVEGAERSSDPRPPADRDAAAAALFEAYYVRLVALARRILADPDLAEDVTMDAFVGLYRRWHRVRRPEDAYFYLRASVVNGSRNRIRGNLVARSKAALFGREVGPVPDMVAPLLEQQTIVDALRRLSTRQRQVLVLRYYEELSETEIAGTLGCSVGSVKTHAARGLKALAAQLEETA